MTSYKDNIKLFGDAMLAKGHTPVVDNYGDIDGFAYSEGFCNGPKCETCGWATCWHCYPDPSDIPNCTNTKG